MVVISTKYFIHPQCGTRFGIIFNPSDSKYRLCPVVFSKHVANTRYRMAKS